MRRWGEVWDAEMLDACRPAAVLVEVAVCSLLQAEIQHSRKATIKYLSMVNLGKDSIVLSAQ